jgi:hypothetical protein
MVRVWGQRASLAPLCIVPWEQRSEEMFEKAHIDALFGELDHEWRGKPDFEKVSRETHLGIALWDAGRPLDTVDPRAVALIEKHKPKG